MLRVRVPIAVCVLASGCQFRFDVPDDASIACAAQAPLCPAGWECDQVTGLCFHGAYPPGVEVSPAAGVITSEAGATAQDSISVKLRSAPTADVTVPLASSDVGEGRPLVDQLTFTSSNWDQAQLVKIVGVDDDLIDGAQSYEIVVGPTASADGRYQGQGPVHVQAQNDDADVAALSVIAEPVLSTDETGATSSFTAALTAQPSDEVVVPVASSLPGEGLPSPTELRFNAGNWSLPQRVFVTGQNDPSPTPDGTTPYAINLGPTTSADSNFVGKTAQVSCANADDDTPGYQILPATTLVTGENGTAASFTVRLYTQPSAAVTVTLTPVPASEASVAPGQLSFDAGTWNVPQQVVVTGVDDAAAPVVDGAQSFAVQLTAASTDVSYGAIDPPDVSGLNQDNDSAGFTFTPSGGLLVSETGTTAQFTASLQTVPTGDVTLNLSVSPAGEASIDMTSVSFDAGNWNVPQTIRVTGLNDLPPAADGAQSFAVVTAVVSADPNYAASDPPDVTGVNSDDDSPQVVRSAPLPINPLETAAAQGLVSLFLSTQPTGDVTVPIVVAGGVAIPPFVSFDAGNWSAPQAIMFDPADDNLRTGDWLASMTFGPAQSSDPAYAGLTAQPVQITVRDEERLVFLASAAQDGNMGSVAGADAICNADAPKSILAAKALVMVAQVRTLALDWVLRQGYNYIRQTDGVVIKRANASRVWAFPLLSPLVGIGPSSYWTGIDPASPLNGPWAPTQNCTGWTSSSALQSGQVGYGNQTDQTAVGAALAQCSPGTVRLICVEQ